MQSFDKPPLKPALSGLAVEYRIVQLYSRDAGKREATISFNVGQGHRTSVSATKCDVCSLPARALSYAARAR